MRSATTAAAAKRDDNASSSSAKLLNKLKQMRLKLEMYCDRLIVLGFNSQKYDIPLIENYLPSSLARLDAMPRFLVKKGGGYMVIASPKLKFLYVTNYLAAGTSLEKLYSSYGVYQWFNRLDKLKATSLPPK